MKIYVGWAFKSQTEVVVCHCWLAANCKHVVFLHTKINYQYQYCNHYQYSLRHCHYVQMHEWEGMLAIWLLGLGCRDMEYILAISAIYFIQAPEIGIFQNVYCYWGDKGVGGGGFNGLEWVQFLDVWLQRYFPFFTWKDYNLLKCCFLIFTVDTWHYVSLKWLPWPSRLW